MMLDDFFTGRALCISLFILTYGAEPFLRSYQLCSYSRTFQHFMEPKGSFTCSQEPSTGPYSEQFIPKGSKISKETCKEVHAHLWVETPELLQNVGQRWDTPACKCLDIGCCLYSSHLPIMLVWCFPNHHTLS
jgi:hypothetical protein